MEADLQWSDPVRWTAVALAEDRTAQFTKRSKALGLKFIEGVLGSDEVAAVRADREICATDLLAELFAASHPASTALASGVAYDVATALLLERDAADMPIGSIMAALRTLWIFAKAKEASYREILADKDAGQAEHLATGTESDRADEYEPETDDTLAEWAARLSASVGEQEADELARGIMCDYCLRDALGMPQSPVALGWIAAAFDRMLNGETPGDVLPLTARAPHRPKGVGEERAADVAWWVAITCGLGYSEPEAHQMAAKVFPYDERSIRRMKKSAAKWIAAMNSDVDWQGYFARRLRPLPKPKAAATK